MCNWVCREPLRSGVLEMMESEHANLSRLLTRPYRQELYERLRHRQHKVLSYDYWKVYALLVWLREHGIQL